jgi:hypothetical protein
MSISTTITPQILVTSSQITDVQVVTNLDALPIPLAGIIAIAIVGYVCMYGM